MKSQPSFPRGVVIGLALRRYFYSGWAFLIPYLLTYLLYAWQKWPANPVVAASDHTSLASSQLPLVHSPFALVPCLLHVYWALHAINVVLAALALRSWWKATTQTAVSDELSVKNSDGLTLNSQRSTLNSVDSTDTPSPSHSAPVSNFSAFSFQLTAFGKAASPALPWLLLALLFYIPGVYLEWPSDPWEHLRRINEWRILDTVRAHSSWYKTAYFMPYSLLSWCVGLRQLFWLDFYYTGICLLLCWQYFRLARACGLGERASMVFVILQALLFGNNIFSFYRYYGISSSIYAQLGAVALTRVILEFASSGTRLKAFLQKETEDAEDVRKLQTPISARQTTTAAPLPPVQTNLQTGLQNETKDRRLRGQTPAVFSLPSLTSVTTACRPFSILSASLRLVAPCALLLALIAFNHQQGIGIAGLGILAVLVWRLIEWKRSVLWWLIGGTIILNALFLWLYPRPAIIETYRAQGYLNAWYGFNILDLTSPAGDRVLQIISAFGLVNLAAALLPLRHNHIIAWLTVLPLVILCLPCIAVPFIELLIHHGDESTIIAFHRILFALPPWLVIVHLLESWCKRTHAFPLDGIIGFSAFCGMIFSLTLIVIVPSNKPNYQRFWHTISRFPDDLQMTHLIKSSTRLLNANPKDKPFNILTTFNEGFVLRSIGVENVFYASRKIGVASVDSANALIASIAEADREGSPFYRCQAVFGPTIIPSSPASLAATLSGHWPPQQVSSDNGGKAEIENAFVTKRL